MNMVREGAVEHPDQRTHDGYGEIQAPRWKYALISTD
jgi:hypothetical protein